MGIEVRVAANFDTGSWGAKSYPSSVLINAEGEIVWTGHPGNISSGKVKDALKGAKPSKGGFMAFSVDREMSPKLKSAVKSAAEGKLGKALSAVNKIAGDERADAALREEAQTFAAEIIAFGTALNGQAERFVEARSVAKGILVLDALSAEFAGTELGEEVDGRLKEIASDEDLQKELAAAKAYEKAMAAVDKRGLKKSASKFESIVKKFAGTKAADRAATQLRKI